MLFDGSYKNELKIILDTLKVDRRGKIARGELKVHQSSVQHVLSAATIPSIGKRSVQLEIQRQFPNAVEVKNDFFHLHHPRIVQTYFDMGNLTLLSDLRVRALIRAIRDCSHEKVANAERSVGTAAERQISLAVDPTTKATAAVDQSENESAISGNTKAASNQSFSRSDYSDIVSTMIFVNTSKAATELASVLRGTYKVSCVEFHKDIKDDKIRSKNLLSFQEGREKLMVCTDQAARGLDMSSVRHVVQAEFSLNVVSHLHRVGRASRAGRLGYASNFYDDTSRDLVNSLVNLQSNKSSDENLDISSSFSRRRGFRKRINRRLERLKNREDKQQQVYYGG